MKKFFIIMLLGTYFSHILTAEKGFFTRNIILSNLVRVIRTIRNIKFQNPVSFNPLSSGNEDQSFKDALYTELAKAGSEKITLEIIIKALATIYPRINVAAQILDLIDTPSLYPTRRQISYAPMPLNQPSSYVPEKIIPSEASIKSSGSLCPIPLAFNPLLSIPLNITPEMLTNLTSPDRQEERLREIPHASSKEMSDKEYIKVLKSLMLSEDAEDKD